MSKAIITPRCSAHPIYTGVRLPRVECDPCSVVRHLWTIREKVRAAEDAIEEEKNRLC